MTGDTVLFIIACFMGAFLIVYIAYQQSREENVVREEQEAINNLHSFMLGDLIDQLNEIDENIEGAVSDERKAIVQYILSNYGHREECAKVAREIYLCKHR